MSSAPSLSAALCARPAEMRPIRRSALLLTDMLGHSLSPRLRLSPAATDQKIISYSCSRLQKAALQRDRAIASFYLTLESRSTPVERLPKERLLPSRSNTCFAAGSLRKEEAHASRAACAAELDAALPAWPPAARSPRNVSNSGSSGDVAADTLPSGSKEGPGIRLGLMLRPDMRALPALRMLPGGASPSAASAPAASASGTGSPAAPCSVAERAALLQRSAVGSRRGAAGDFLAGARAFCRSATAPGSGHSVSTQQLVTSLESSASAMTVSGMRGTAARPSASSRPADADLCSCSGFCSAGFIKRSWDAMLWHSSSAAGLNPATPAPVCTQKTNS